MKTTTSGLLMLVVLALISRTLLGEENVRARTPKPPHARDVLTLDSKPQSPEPSALSLLSQHQAGCDGRVSARIEVDRGHPWTPPFGIDRVGAPPVVHVELTSEQTLHREYFVITYSEGKESERRTLSLRRNPTFHSLNGSTKDSSSFFASAQFTSVPTELALYARCSASGQVEELARQQVNWLEIEADAAARPNRQINPVDLGAILVPHDWLLLAGRQTALVSTVAISHTRDIPDARLRAWFDGGKVVEISMPLSANRRSMKEIELPLPSRDDRTVLHVRLAAGNQELWTKEIQTMIVVRRPRWPTFGAVETKLRYDAPISMHDPNTGATFPSIDYDAAWDPKLNDVVVFLPTGGRFVFWRGSSYVPFWGSSYNTGVCYQWAENFSIPVHHPDGSIDLPEPLFDRELRYGRVRIIESTRSRVHVRWTYQLTDVHYNIWGDQATEDYYFYPDGFATRVLTVISAPNTPYQLTEFIVLTPQAAFPFEVLPTHMADVLFLDGEKKSITFPFQRDKEMPAGQLFELVANPREVPMVYRLFAHKNDPAAAIYFSPHDATTPKAYEPLYDRGQMVTPTYWGSHWPLGRGKWTHWAIDEGIYSSPAHNSVAGWLTLPKPLSNGEHSMLDTLGRSTNMAMRRWAALIAKTEAEDDVLLDWAQSYSDPPSIEVAGARIDFPSYSPERRAIRLVAESHLIKIKLKPVTRTMNPVFELDQAPKELVSVAIDGKPLPADAYAWDGATLWMKATIDSTGAKISVRFR